MNIIILDDYQDAVRKLHCARLLEPYNAKVFTNTVKGIGQLSVRLRDADVLVLIRERTQFPRALLDKLPKPLATNTLIDERTSKQVYSVDDKRFLPDRYVEGTCPHCGFEKARGDQCDNCGNLLDPTDLINPYSAISGSRDLEVRDTNHLYLLQTKIADRIRAWVDSKSADWPPLTTAVWEITSAGSP